MGSMKSWLVILSDYLISYHTVCLPLWNVTHSGNRSSKTFKPKKNIPEGSHQYELLKHAEATLGSGNLRMAVMLPEGEDLNEWVAVNSKHYVYLFPPPLLHPFWFTFMEEWLDVNTPFYSCICQPLLSLSIVVFLCLLCSCKLNNLRVNCQGVRSWQFLQRPWAFMLAKPLWMLNRLYCPGCECLVCFALN